jgi:hypothetical protein
LFPKKEDVMSLHYLPYPRHPLFTEPAGSLELFGEPARPTRLPSTQLQALVGLCGIGKTQLANEYIYRHLHDYEIILWLDASSRSALSTDLQTIWHAGPAQDDQLFASFKWWLKTQSNWLVVLDQVEEMDYVEMLIPPHAEGHVLLTSRIYATRAWIPSVLVPPLHVTSGARFFLRRASLLSSDESPDQLPAALLQEAIEVVQALHGIPLALDQAGAYLKETGCRPAEYLALYRTDPGKMLKQRGRPIDNSHPASLMETLLQIFDRLSPDALEVLRLFCQGRCNYEPVEKWPPR